MGGGDPEGDRSALADAVNHGSRRQGNCRKGDQQNILFAVHNSPMHDLSDMRRGKFLGHGRIEMLVIIVVVSCAIIVTAAYLFSQR
jgi:hypothetical protein